MRLALRLVPLSLLALVLGALPHGAAPAAAASTPQVLFDFESGPERGRTAAGYGNAGSGTARVTVARLRGGQVRVVAGRTGGRAVRLPAYDGSSSAPVAVLASTSGSRAAVEPGSRDFTFGASFRLDQRSSGRGAHHGDNLVQRGAYGSRGQFKIQLDRRVPSCRVKGDAGTLFVRDSRAVTPGRWYAVNCRRTASGLSLRVRSWGQGGGVRIREVRGRTGTIVPGAHRLSIGGKTSANGTPVKSTDQLNGVVDDVFLRIG